MKGLDKLALNQSTIRLSNTEGVTVLSDWVSVNAKHSMFMLNVRLELLNTPPANDIPEHSTWAIVVDFDTDLWGKVQIYPALDSGAITSTYPHQQYNGGPHDFLPVRNGNICTLSSIHGLSCSRNALRTEPKYTIERIIWHVERAVEWLKNAASNTLACIGDNFELPDFDIPKLSQSRILAYQESRESYAIWKNLVGHAGLASISTLNRTIIVRKYLSKNGTRTCYEPQWGSYMANLKERKAIWVCLDKIPTINHWQVPSTSQELILAARAQNIDLPTIIKGALEHLEDYSECLVLVGMPISNKVGDTAFRYHWQAFSLPAATKIRSPKIRAQLAVSHLMSHTPTPLRWFVNSENWHPDDLQNRGQLNRSLRESNVVLIGCGALGSAISELLVRMGVKKTTIVDKELLDSGNVVRHTLTLNQINNLKALELAARLNSINPTATVEGLSLALPSKDRKFLDAVKDASLIIDCSADDGVMSELPFSGLQPDVKIVSCSIGLHANRLFFYADNAVSFKEDEFNSWFHPFREEEHKLAKKEELPRGVGCWHPLTPAKFNRIMGLAGVVIELIEQVVAEDIAIPVAICHEWQFPQLNLERKTKVA